MTAAIPTEARFKPRNLLGIILFLRKYPGPVGLCLSLLLVNIGIEMALPQIIGDIITNLRRAVTANVAFSPGFHVKLLVALVLVRAGVGFLLGPIRNHVIQSTLGDIRAAIYNAIQRLAFTYHDKANTGELISRSTTDIWRLQDFLFACLFLSVDIGVSLVLTVALIFSIDAGLGALTLGTMAPTIALIAFYAGKLQPQWRNVNDLHWAMKAVIQENIAGERVVKAFAKEAAEIDKFRGKKAAFLNTLMHTVNYWAARVPFAQFTFGLSLPLVLWIGGRQVIQGQLLLGDHRDLPPGRGAVTFENVSFNYQDGKASLTEVSFDAHPGQTMAIIGPTGSGKTTLVNLIPRFYDPSSGRVLIDGVDARELKLDEFRRAVSVIFQETFLFSASVAENIAYGKPAARREEIERCARAAQAHEFIAELENGYDTIIGERGISLSGGQRQRLAIARAFLMDPRILILDDATASVDAKTERLIREAMSRLCEGRTTFVIAQRFSTVQDADLILVLN